MSVKKNKSGACVFRRLLFAAALLWAAAHLGCAQRSVVPGEVQADLPEIRERGVLRAITTFSSTSYFIYRGQTMGFEYELLERLAQHLNLRLEIVVADDIDRLIEMLRNGEGDIVAHNLAITRERQDLVAFTEPLTTTYQVLVQRKPENWRHMKQEEIDRMLVRSPADLIDKTVHVRRGSSYYERLRNLGDEAGGVINVEVVDGSISTETLIRMVAQGDIDYTVADENLAYIHKTEYPILDVQTPISLPQRIAWTVRQSSPKLLAEVNAWFGAMKKTPTYFAVYNKYFRNRKSFQRRPGKSAFALGSDRLSPYDSLIQSHSERIGWDWRLVAALVYQESQFDPDAQSYAGACGLMQMMPTTAALFGITPETIFDPAKNIEAGVDYLAQLEKLYDEVPDSLERVKFVLAAYNVGVAHVQDARRLAGKYGEDPYFWTDSVEEYMLLKADPVYYEDSTVRYGYSRGSEPVQFVREILDRYEHYKRLIDVRPVVGPLEPMQSGL